MRQLVLYQVNPFTQHFIHDGACHGPKPVGGVDFFAVAHTAQSRIDGVFTHGPLARAQAGEHITPMASNRMHAAQQLHGLL